MERRDTSIMVGNTEANSWCNMLYYEYLGKRIVLKNMGRNYCCRGTVWFRTSGIDCDCVDIRDKGACYLLMTLYCVALKGRRLKNY